MILPLMTRQAAGFHPLSYAVWYEYVAGNIPQLRAAIDALLATSKTLDDADIAHLFDEFIVMREVTASTRVRDQIQQLVEEVTDVTSEASHEVGQFGTGLDGFRQHLQTATDPVALTGAVRVMIDDTSRVRGKTETFQQHLRKSSQEVVRLREALEVVNELAMTDPLTGLFNRRGFDQQVERLGANGSQRCCVLIVDIDHFKAINDTHGHLLGDKVIAAVAQVLKSCVDSKGTAARIGGEEFALVLPGASAAGGAELAERVRAAVEMGRLRRAESEMPIGKVTVSIGLATRVGDEGFEALISRADRALYQSKQAGRNRVSIDAGVNVDAGVE